MYTGRRIGLAVLLIVVGVAIALNCIRAGIAREGMYDTDSTRTMAFANTAGIVIGAGMALLGLAIMFDYADWLLRLW